MKTETKVEATHTAGPWTLEMGQGGGRQIKGILGADESKRDMAEFLLRGDVPVTFATDVWVQFPNPEWNQMQDANFRLMTAAPELLEALEGLAAYFKYMVKDPQFKEYVDAVNAINKAKGL